MKTFSKLVNRVKQILIILRVKEAINVLHYEVMRVSYDKEDSSYEIYFCHKIEPYRRRVCSVVIDKDLKVSYHAYNMSEGALYWVEDKEISLIRLLDNLLILMVIDYHMGDLIKERGGEVFLVPNK